MVAVAFHDSFSDSLIRSRIWDMVCSMQISRMATVGFCVLIGIKIPFIQRVWYAVALNGRDFTGEMHQFLNARKTGIKCDYDSFFRFRQRFAYLVEALHILCRYQRIGKAAKWGLNEKVSNTLISFTMLKIADRTKWVLCFIFNRAKWKKLEH